MKKILIILYILIFVVLTYYVTTLFIDRDLTDDTKASIKKEITNNVGTSDKSQDAQKNIDDNKELDADVVDNDVTTESNNSAYSISTEDCNSQCTKIVNTDKKEYCEQACGLSTNTSTDSCDALSGLEKDYCIKDKSISQKDINGCSAISDAGIKKQCQNRINEEFIDEIM